MIIIIITSIIKAQSFIAKAQSQWAQPDSPLGNHRRDQNMSPNPTQPKVAGISQNQTPIDRASESPIPDGGGTTVERSQGHRHLLHRLPRPPWPRRHFRRGKLFPFLFHFSSVWLPGNRGNRKDNWNPLLVVLLWSFYENRMVAFAGLICDAKMWCLQWIWEWIQFHLCVSSQVSLI